MRTVIVAWLLVLVTLVVLALGVAFWTECSSADASETRYGPSIDPIDKG